MAATSQGSSKNQAASKKGSSRAPRLSVTPAQLGELTGILVAVGGMLIFLSLVSYNPFDPSFSTAAPPGASAHNWIGVTGAYLADILVQLFGWSAFLIPLVLVVFGLSRLIGRGVKTPGSKAVGTLATIKKRSRRRFSRAASWERFPFLTTLFKRPAQSFRK